ncbi:MAG: helix-turn-helix domain-containing protein [Cryobacterium sp.]|nr:helix-turn-helix domain-containing protein [Cryobacterium sp.]
MNRVRIIDAIVLAAADGQRNAQIARDLGLHVDTVRTWRGRFAAAGMKGLADRPRSGRPLVFAATVVAQIKALACSLPAPSGRTAGNHREWFRQGSEWDSVVP